MSDEFDIVDEDDMTMEIEDDDEYAVDEDEGGEDEDFAEEDFAPIAAPRYRPDSNVYTVLLGLSIIAYCLATYVVLTEAAHYSGKDSLIGGLQQGK